MDKEILGYKEGKHFEIVRRSDTLGTIIKSIWSFKCKRDPSGSITKHKAHICAHGGMQRWGEGYYETYSPVVNWLSIRFLLTMSVALDLDTCSIDFTMAYPQAHLKTDVYMEIPWGYEIEGEEHSSAFCMKLLTNWYGLRDAGLNWFDCVKSGLQKCGFHQSAIDPCLFTRG